MMIIFVCGPSRPFSGLPCPSFFCFLFFFCFVVTFFLQRFVRESEPVLHNKKCGAFLFKKKEKKRKQKKTFILALPQTWSRDDGQNQRWNNIFKKMIEQTNKPNQNKKYVTEIRKWFTDSNIPTRIERAEKQNRVRLGVPWVGHDFCRVLPGFSVFQWVWFDCTRFSWIASDLIGLEWVWTRYYWVLLSSYWFS